MERNYPKITFGIIVLNGEPFTRYCLKSLYPYAHEIIVVEGGHIDTTSVCTPDGHSIDGTLETLNKFKKDEDPENKLTIVTREGFWPKKDELGRDRTPQSRAYAELATGDYLWQVDIDEFYTEKDMKKILHMLLDNPEITAVTFPTYTFWGDINYLADSWALRRRAKYYHRLFKWDKGYRYVTHEPPTIVDENGIDLREKNWIDGAKMTKKGILMYHYSLLFPWQVEQKVKLYKEEKPDSCSEIIQWADDNYFKLKNPYRIHNLYKYPSWLERFTGEHPQQVIQMMNDIKNKKIKTDLRQINDIEKLLQSKNYVFKSYLLKGLEPIDKSWGWFIFNISRIKNIPNKLMRTLKKI